MSNSIDLSEFVGQRVYVRLRNEVEMVVLVNENSDPDSDFPFELNRYSYTKSGEYLFRGVNCLDIIEIRPADSVTLLKWITDRVPTEQDGLRACILRKTDDGMTILTSVKTPSSLPWAHCPGWKAPDPDPRTTEISEIRSQLAELQKRLKELE